MPTIRPPISNPLGSTDGDLKIARLEKIVRYLLLKSLTAEPLAPTDKVLCEFLGIQDANPTRELVLRRVGASDVLGRLACPACGAGVLDVTGITDEHCQSCGAVVGSAR